MRSSLRSGVCLLSSVALLACGAPAREAQSPAYAGAPPPASPVQQQQAMPTYAQPTTMPAAPGTSPVAPLPISPSSEKAGEKKNEEDGKLAPRTREESVADFIGSEKAIFLSAPDCATACRALRSMSRAAGRACEPPAPSTSEIDCKEIGARVGRAKTRVTEVCGVCPDGPP